MLTDTELQMLELLTARGSLSAGRLAKLSGIKRPTVYAALESLSNLGLVITHRNKGVSHFTSHAPHIIERLLSEQAERKLKTEKVFAASLGSRLSQVQQLGPQKIAGYEVSSLDTPELVSVLLEEALLKGNYSAIFNPQVVLRGTTRELVQRTLKSSLKSKPVIRELCTPGPAFDWYKKEIRNPRHQLRALTQAGTSGIETDMIFIDGAVVLLNYEPSGELAIRIRQPQLYRTMNAIFELLWTSSQTGGP